MASSLKTLLPIVFVALLILFSKTLPTSSAVVHNRVSDSLTKIFYRNLLQVTDRHQANGRRRTRRTVVRDQAQAPSPSTANRSQTLSIGFGSILGLFIIVIYSICLSETLPLLLLLF
uniref:Transmembrane protein n=1 Tax=Cucumis melo TaxID=3656 RepID=A0A9I9E592_CUCME